jgi:pseudouridine kinase
LSAPGSGGVICVGGAVADRKFHLAAPPVARTSNPAARTASSDGGVARNVAENLGRLGVRAALVSRVGDDAAGYGIVGRLTAAGVDVGGVTVVPGAVTAEYVAVLAPDGDLVLGVAAMDVFGGITVGDAERVLDATRPAWCFADCNPPDAVVDGLRAAAAARGARLAVDATSTAKAARLPRDLTGVDLLFCNAEEAAAYLAATDPPEVLAGALLAGGAAAVVVTLGAAGLVLADGGGPRRVPAVPGPVVDVTGAGDALVAGTLAALLADADLDRAVTAGARLAAATVASPASVVPATETGPGRSPL